MDVIAGEATNRGGAGFVDRYNRLWLVEQTASRSPRHPFEEYHPTKTA